MKARGLKFTIMTIFVLVLIAAYLGVGLFVAPTVQANDSVVVEDPLDGLPTGDTEGGAEPDDDADDKYEEELILPADPLALVNYALNDLYSSPGYKGTIKMDGYVTGSWGSTAELTLQQLAVGNIENCGSESLEELYFYYNPSVVSPLLINIYAVMSEYRAINTNSATGQAFRVGTKSFNLNEQTYDLNGTRAYFEAKSFEDMLAKFQIIYSLPMTMKFTRANSYCSGYPSETSLYKSVQIKLYSSAIPYEVRAYYRGLSSFIPVLDSSLFKGLTYTFVINKKTGELARMLIQHDVSGTIGLVGLQTKLTALIQYQIDYTIMDKAFEVRKPYLDSPKYEEYLKSLEDENTVFVQVA